MANRWDECSRCRNQYAAIPERRLSVAAMVKPELKKASADIASLIASPSFEIFILPQPQQPSIVGHNGRSTGEGTGMKQTKPSVLGLLWFLFTKEGGTWGSRQHNLRKENAMRKLNQIAEQKGNSGGVPAETRTRNPLLRRQLPL